MKDFTGAVGVAIESTLPTGFPAIPEDFLKKFPELSVFNEKSALFWRKVRTNISSTTDDISVEAGAQRERTSTLESSLYDPNTGLLARVSTIESTYATDSDVSASITTALTAAAGDAQARVNIEALARATADGNLSGKYTLSVTAGDVVTGMNITSSTSAGTPVSSISFQTSVFRIYNGTTGVSPFSLSGSNIVLNGNVTVNGPLDVGSTIERTVINGTTFRRGNPTGNRTEIFSSTISGYTSVVSWNSSNNPVARFGTEAAGGHGILRLATAAGAELIFLDGDTGRITFSEQCIGPLANAASPTYTFLGRTGDGFYSPAIGTISMALVGVQSFRFAGGANDYSLEVGIGRSASGFAFIDLIGDTTYSDYGLRFIRGNGGANTFSEIQHRGTGFLRLSALDAGSVALATSSTDRLSIDSNGVVRMSYYGSGTLVTDSTGLISVSSDARLKDIKAPFTRGLPELRAFKSWVYHWTKKSGLCVTDVNVGWMAQEVRKSIPEAVNYYRDRDQFTFNDRPILAATVNAVLAVDDRVDALRDRVRQLEDEIARIAKRN
jgi:hypothetical protein